MKNISPGVIQQHRSETEWKSLFVVKSIFKLFEFVDIELRAIVAANVTKLSISHYVLYESGHGWKSQLDWCAEARDHKALILVFFFLFFSGDT